MISRFTDARAALEADPTNVRVHGGAKAKQYLFELKLTPCHGSYRVHSKRITVIFATSFMIKISDQIAYCSRFNDRVDDVHSESNDADAILNPANLKGIYL